MSDNTNNGGQLNLVVPIDSVEVISEWIRDALQKEPISYEKPYAEETRLEIYFDSLLEAEIAEKAIPAAFEIKHAEAREYTAQDWTTFWQHHFKVLDIGQQLRIVPEWEEIPDEDRINILINPGLSFGTGGHFTTRFCLEALEEAITKFEPTSMIDAGTGSGILSIAAAKFGLERIEAFDYDPVCVEQCVENAERNGETGRIHFFEADVLERGWFKEPADVVCANILTSVLIEAAPLIIRSAKKRLILSGIREVEADGVAEAFVNLGAKEISRDGDGQWSGLVLDV